MGNLFETIKKVRRETDGLFSYLDSIGALSQKAVSSIETKLYKIEKMIEKKEKKVGSNRR
jgi:hypothetical protein